MYQQPHHRINKNQAATQSLYTTRINVLYFDRIESNARTSEPQPRGHESYNVGRPFLRHYYFILNLSDLCMGVEKLLIHFNYMTNMATP